MKSGNIILTIVEKRKVNYYEFDIKKVRKEKLDFFPNNIDGHPSENPKDKNFIITDSYPDKFSNQSLFIVNKKKKHE